MDHQTERPGPAQCPRCAEAADAADQFCRHCGRSLKHTEAWYYEPAWILALALLVVGPFALVLVWKSPKLSLAAKAALAAIILVYSALCAYLMCKIGMYGYRQIQELNEAMRDIGSL